LRLFPTHLRTTFRLDLLSTAAARIAIQGPAREARVDFTDAAAGRLVESLSRVRVRRPRGMVDIPGPYVEPVQLQVVCERLWERPRADVMEITESDVQEVGDVDSALAGYYTEKVRLIAAETSTDERVIRAWFDRALIVEPGLRAQVLVGPLQRADGDDRVLRLLQEAHLIRAENRGSARWFELAHDRLIEPVQTSNVEWREANLQPFQRQAGLWQSEDRPDHLLLAGDALHQVVRWVEEHPGELTAAERQFLAASRARNELQHARRVRWMLIAMSVVIGVMVITFAVAAFNVHLALSRQLVSEAATLFETDPAAALSKALDAMAWPSVREARIALTNSLAESHARAILEGHGDAVTSGDFSPNGRLVLTVSNDRTVRVWDATTGQQLHNLEGPEGGMFSAEWSPDGSRIVTASPDNAARVWDARTGRQQRILDGHEGSVLSAQWSPDGFRIVT
ncbi:MAG: WD40 repeat domain-containing protein, partial [Pseudonocardiaceae bacterium]